MKIIYYINNNGDQNIPFNNYSIINNRPYC